MRNRGRVRKDAKLYVEDVFSAYTYAGNSGPQTIPNGLDLLNKGGLIVTKNRDGLFPSVWADTARGLIKRIASNSTGGQQDFAASSFFTALSNGYQINSNSDAEVNQNPTRYLSLAFRQANKFFKVVTFTGNGTTQVVPHTLGTTPGMVIIKRLDTTSFWCSWHIGAPTSFFQLETTGVAQTANAHLLFGDNTTTVAPTATGITVGNYAGVNAAGGTYVAYIFAHDSTSDGIIQCGSFTTDASRNATINLGWEPQFILMKTRNGPAGQWILLDSTRGLNFSSNGEQYHYLNQATSENSLLWADPSASGFKVGGNAEISTNYIYMAIRKGDMRPPTDATKVLALNTSTGTNNTRKISAPFAPSALISKIRGGASQGAEFTDRSSGQGFVRTPASTASDTSFGGDGASNLVFDMDGITLGGSGYHNAGFPFVYYMLKQARGFFDIAHYTGTGVAHAEPHNLGVVPELMIIKQKNNASNWAVYYGDNTDHLRLNSSTATADDLGMWNYTSPTATSFTLGNNQNTVNGSSVLHVNYLFATCPGVSKVGTYFGNGASQNINCGFTSGARFVMIKRIDAADDWHVFDAARGILTGQSENWFYMNSTLGDQSGSDRLDAYAAGFKVNAAMGSPLYVNGGTFLYLAIA